MSAMEITDRRSSTWGELVFWRGRDGDGRETYAATWSIGGVAQEPTSDAVCYSQLAAMEVASRDAVCYSQLAAMEVASREVKGLMCALCGTAAQDVDLWEIVPGRTLCASCTRDVADLYTAIVEPW